MKNSSFGTPCSWMDFNSPIEKKCFEENSYSVRSIRFLVALHSQIEVVDAESMARRRFVARMFTINKNRLSGFKS